MIDLLSAADIYILIGFDSKSTQLHDNVSFCACRGKEEMKRRKTRCLVAPAFETATFGNWIAKYKEGNCCD